MTEYCGLLASGVVPSYSRDRVCSLANTVARYLLYISWTSRHASEPLWKLHRQTRSDNVYHHSVAISGDLGLGLKADDSLSRWLENKQRDEFGALQRDNEILHALLTGQKSTHITAQDIVGDVSSEPIDPDSDRAWRAWQLLFAAMNELPQYHHVLVDLMIAIAAILPPDSGDGSSNCLPRNFPAEFRDEHDRLQTYCHLPQRHEFEPAIR